MCTKPVMDERIFFGCYNSQPCRSRIRRTSLDCWRHGTMATTRRCGDLIPLVYPEMRRIARRYLARRASHHTLESAALANEAYLKLLHAQGIQCVNRAHFFAVCAQMIRRILVDHARSRRYAKRGGAFVHVTLDERSETK